MSEVDFPELFSPPANCPQDCLVDSQGRFVPISQISEIDALRDDVVRGSLSRVLALQAQLKAAKADVVAEVDAFMALSAGDSGVDEKQRWFRLASFDGRLQIRRTAANIEGFNEKIGFAQELITNCLDRWAEKSSVDELRSIVQAVFKRSKSGTFDRDLLNHLFKVKSEDAEWNKAIKVLRESIEVFGKKSYTRFYFREKVEQDWKLVALDWSRL